MNPFAGAARWTAIIIAAAAVIDPAVSLPVRARPAVRVTGTASENVARQLRDAGFPLDEPGGEVAEVLVGDHLPSARGTEHPALRTEHSALSTEHPALGTEHPALSTEHPALSTEHPALSTEHPALSHEHPALSTEHPALSTEHPALSTEHP